MVPYFKIKGNILQELHHNLNAYNNHMTNAYISLSEIQKNFETLKQISEQVKLGPNMINVFTQYHDFIRNWKKSQLDQTYVIRDTVNSFYKEYRDNCYSFSEILEKEENLRSEVLFEGNNLNAKKEKLWMSMDARTWDMNPMEPVDQTKLFADKEYAKSRMCFKETGELNQKNLLLGIPFCSTFFSGILNTFCSKSPTSGPKAN